MKPDVEFIASPNFFTPLHREIRALIIHATGTDGIDSPIHEFQNAETKKSAHYMIGKDGRIVQMVRDVDIAYHAGESSWHGLEYKNPKSGTPTMNNCSIGIELVNKNDGSDLYPEAQIAALILIGSWIIKTYSISLDDVTGHENIAPGRKTDPGAAFPWNEVRTRLQAA